MTMMGELGFGDFWVDGWMGGRSWVGGFCCWSFLGVRGARWDGMDRGGLMNGMGSLMDELGRLRRYDTYLSWEYVELRMASGWPI